MNPKTDGRSRTVQQISFGDIRLQGGLLQGTTVLTLDGALPVEHLMSGDRIITRDEGASKLHAVRVTLMQIRCVNIKAGTFGHGRPDDDLILPASTRVNIRDWRAQALYNKPEALIPAYRLIDREYVTDLGDLEIRQYQLMLDGPQIFYAGGLEIAAPAMTTTARHV
jgi:hypothetical protein